MPEPKDPNKTPDPVFLGYYPDGTPVYSDELKERIEAAWQSGEKVKQQGEESDDD